MSNGKVWYWVHLGLGIATALVVIASFVWLFAFNSLIGNSLISNSIQAAVILLFVMPGTLLVYGINQLILWRRKPRVVRTPDVVVIVIFTALAAVTLSTAFWSGGIVLSFFSVPLLMIAGVVSTIVIAFGNARAHEPELLTTPVVAGSAPVGATLDQLFPAQMVAGAPAATTPVAAEPGAAATELGTTPYGPKP